MQIPSAVWAIIGSLVTAIPIITGQLIEQHFEDRRYLQNMAYQYAWQEWKAIFDAKAENKLPGVKLQNFRAKLVEHLILTAMLADAEIDEIAEGKGIDLFWYFFDEYTNGYKPLPQKESSDQNKPSTDNHPENEIKSR